MGREVERVRERVCEEEREREEEGRVREEEEEKESKSGRVSGQQYPIDHPTNLLDERGTSYPTIVARLIKSSPLRDRKRFSRRADSRDFDSVWKFLSPDRPSIYLQVDINKLHHVSDSRIEISWYQLIDLRLLINEWERTYRNGMNGKQYRRSIYSKRDALLVGRTSGEYASNIRHIDWVAYELLMAESVQTWQFHREYQPMAGGFRLGAP